MISGTPTTAGISNFTVQVTDDNSATATKALSITVNAYPAITTVSLSDGTVNLAYSQTLTSTGGTLPIAWSITVGTLPAGIALTAARALSAGRRRQPVRATITVRVTDGNGAYAESALSITDISCAVSNHDDAFRWYGEPCLQSDAGKQRW